MAEPQAILGLRPQEIAKSEQQPSFWLAAYTRSRHELVVATQFQQKGLDALLPTYRRLSRWSDRIRRIETPAISRLCIRTGRRCRASPRSSDRRSGEHCLSQRSAGSVVGRRSREVAPLHREPFCRGTSPLPARRSASPGEAWSLSRMGGRAGGEEKLRPAGDHGGADHEVGLD